MAVVRPPPQVQRLRKGLLEAYCFRGLELWSIMSGSMATGRHGVEVAESFYLDPQAGDRMQALTENGVLGLLKPQSLTPSDIPPVGSHLLILA